MSLQSESTSSPLVSSGAARLNQPFNSVAAPTPYVHRGVGVGVAGGGHQGARPGAGGVVSTSSWNRDMGGQGLGAVVQNIRSPNIGLGVRSFPHTQQPINHRPFSPHRSLTVSHQTLSPVRRGGADPRTYYSFNSSTFSPSPFHQNLGTYDASTIWGQDYGSTYFSYLRQPVVPPL